MKNSSIRLALYLNYFVFAILLNSVGIIVLKAQKQYGVDEMAAATLEPFKDFSIAIVSFLIASFLPRIGYKRSMMIGLGMVSAACLVMYFGNSFWAARILFAAVGAAFALIKVSVYSVIGLVTIDTAEHNRLMSSIEGVFMFGVALGYFIFPFFNSETDPNAWLNTYLLLGGMSVVALIVLASARFEETARPPGANLGEDFAAMLGLILRRLVVVFLAAAFLFVMIEQGIMTWLPTFNDRVLNYSPTLAEASKESISIMLASILAISLGLGRLIAGWLSGRFSWFTILSVFVLAAAAMVLFVLPLVVSIQTDPITGVSSLPWTAYAFPMVGFFIGPIYPLINSVILSNLPKRLHSPMSGLIIVFSALGGTFGSMLNGYLFKTMGAQTAFSFTIVPMALLLLALYFLWRWTRHREAIPEADVDRG